MGTSGSAVHTRLKSPWMVLIALIVGGFLGYWLCKCISSADNSGSNKNTSGTTPVEFLLLDANRVDSYLAQLNNGRQSSVHLRQKLVRSASVSGGIKGAAEGQAGVEEEDFVEREVTPTAASRLIELEKKLHTLLMPERLLHQFRKATEIKSVKGRAVTELEDGDMVRFRATIHAPRYIEPFLAVSREATVAALLPETTHNRGRRAYIEARRTAVRKFRKQVGSDPRLVLTIHPKQKHSKQRDITVMMPVRMRQLTEERSLLRTGGVFTIIGKVVRIFSPSQGAVKTRKRQNAYIDLATLHTWLQPITNATGELICSSNLSCSTKLKESEGTTGRTRRKAITGTRRSMINALEDEVRIERSGGMLLIPIAIFR